ADTRPPRTPRTGPVRSWSPPSAAGPLPDRRPSSPTPRRCGSPLGPCAAVRASSLSTSCQREEQLLQLLAVQILLRVAQALLHAAGDDRKAGAVQRLGDGGELGDHVLAVRALLEHAGDGAQLALGALETVDHRGHIGRIEFHDALLGVGDSIPRIYPRGCLVYPRGYMRCSMRTPREPGPHRLAAPGAR